MADNRNVLVVAEVADGKLASISTELLGCANKLAKDLGEQVAAVVMGKGVGNAAQEAIAYGASKVYVVDDPQLEVYQSDSYATALGNVISKAAPRAVIMGQTSAGRDLMPRLAFRLKTGLCMDCVSLGIDPQTKLLRQVRGVYGGNAQAIFTSKGMPQMATVRAKAMEALVPDSSRKGEVLPVAAGIDPAKMRTKLVKKIKEQSTGIKLEDSPIVVCGGRGIGGPEGFKELSKLAEVLKGAVGATRPPCDAGWVPTSMQIGLTGKIVTPNVYIAVALSGSSQHLAGMSGSKCIIAINRDPEANIFKEAAFGVVGDWKVALPAFMDKVRELLAQ